MWIARIRPSSLNYETGNFLETSPDRPLTEVICTSIKSILKKPAAQAKDISEVTDKVRIKTSADVPAAWKRMLMTIDGINEPELETINDIIPR